MTAISTIYDHYGLKLFVTFCVHTIGQNVFSWLCLTQSEVREKGKSGYWGGSSGDNLLFVVSHLYHFFFFDMAFDFYSPDVDECANPRSCPEHSTCHNSLGSYSCVCNTGYESRSGKKNFQGQERHVKVK